MHMILALMMMGKTDEYEDEGDGDDDTDQNVGD